MKERLIESIAFVLVQITKTVMIWLASVLHFMAVVAMQVLSSLLALIIAAVVL